VLPVVVVKLPIGTIVVMSREEDKPGVILDFDEEGNLIALEIVDVSRRVTETRRVEFATIK